MEEQTYANNAGGIMAIMGSLMLIIFALTLIIIIAYWKIFTKAGKPGWAAIIPIYSGIVLLEIVGKPIWWIILFLIPGVNIIIAIIVIHRLSIAFGKDIGMTLLLLLIPIVGYPVLAFGDAKYIGPAAAVSTTT